MNPLIVKYRLKIAAKAAAGRTLSLLPRPRLTAFPAVTLFISNLNTRYPLELTLNSLVRNTRYPNYTIWIGDNASTDGSLAFLESLRSRQSNVMITSSGEPRRHSDWLDDVFHQVQTPYWVAIDSDVLFLGSDWLADLIFTMENKLNLFLMSAEPKITLENYHDPYSGGIVDTAFVPSTWLFCVRTALRERISASFAWSKEGVSPKTGNPIVYDTGGKVLRAMREQNLTYDVMPNWFTMKYHHFGSLSWIHEHDLPNAYGMLKRYQSEDIKRRVLRGTNVAGWRVKPPRSTKTTKKGRA